MQYHGDKNHEFCEHPRNAAIKGKAHATLSAKEYCDNRRYLWTYYSTNVNQFKCVGHEDPDKRVVISILAKDKAYSLRLFLACLDNLDYDHQHLHLYIRTNDNNDDTVEILTDFIRDHGDKYGSIYFDSSSLFTGLKEIGGWCGVRYVILGEIRQKSVAYARKLQAHYFVIDCDNFVSRNSLKDLMNHIDQYKVIAPMLTVPNQFYSNFHASIDKNGYSADNHFKKKYREIHNRTTRGVIEVPVVHCTYLIHRNVLSEVCYDDGSLRMEYVIFSDHLRKKGIKQYLMNTEHYGEVYRGSSELALVGRHHYPDFFISDFARVIYSTKKAIPGNKKALDDIKVGEDELLIKKAAPGLSRVWEIAPKRLCRQICACLRAYLDGGIFSEFPNPAVPEKSRCFLKLDGGYVIGSVAGHPALRKILSRLSEIAKNPYTTSLPVNTLEHLASELPEDSGLNLVRNEPATKAEK